MSEEADNEVVAPTPKKRWAGYIEKASLAVLGFVAMFLFNSIISLQNQVAALEEKRSGDRAQWEMIRQHTLTMAEMQALQMVHEKIIQDYTSQLINRKIVVEISQETNEPKDDLAGDGSLAPRFQFPMLKEPSETEKAIEELRKLHAENTEPVERFQQRMIQRYEVPNQRATVKRKK